MDMITMGTLTIRQRAEESFEGKTASKKKSVGRIIPFHVTDDSIDLHIGYVIFINGEREIRTVSVKKEFDIFGRLKQGLRLTIKPIPDLPRLLYAELRQALPKDSFDKHETLHTVISEFDLDQGAGLSVFEELRKTGAEVGKRKELLGETGNRSSYLCTRFSKDNLWTPIVAYAATRILPIARGFTGSFAYDDSIWE